MPASKIDFTIGAARTFPVSLGDASDASTGRLVIQVVGAGTYSLTPKARVRNAGIADGSLQSVPYTNRATRVVSVAGTAITAAGLYDVDASAVEIVLDGSYTSGACAVYSHPLYGDGADWIPSSVAPAGTAISGLQPVLVGAQDLAAGLRALQLDLTPADGRGYQAYAALLTIAESVVYNGAAATYDRVRGNSATTLLASAARTTTQTSADLTIYNERFIDVILDMTLVGTGSVTLQINGKDPASGKYYSLIAGATVTTNATNVYRVGPGLLAAAGAVANFALPRTIQIVVNANNANSATYSVGYNLSI